MVNSDARERKIQALNSVSEALMVPDLGWHVHGLDFTDFSIPLPVGIVVFYGPPWVSPCPSNREARRNVDGLWDQGQET